MIFMRLWDGYRFRGKVFDGSVYQTCKVSLAYYLLRVLEGANPQYTSVHAGYAKLSREIILSLQRGMEG